MFGDAGYSGWITEGGGGGGGGGVESVTGLIVDNTDPANPVVDIPSLQPVLLAGSVLNQDNTIDQSGFSFQFYNGSAFAATDNIGAGVSIANGLFSATSASNNIIVLDNAGNGILAVTQRDPIKLLNSSNNSQINIYGNGAIDINANSGNYLRMSSDTGNVSLENNFSFIQIDSSGDIDLSNNLGSQINMDNSGNVSISSTLSFSASLPDGNGFTADTTPNTYVTGGGSSTGTIFIQGGGNITMQSGTGQILMPYNAPIVIEDDSATGIYINSNNGYVLLEGHNNSLQLASDGSISIQSESSSIFLTSEIQLITDTVIQANAPLNINFGATIASGQVLTIVDSTAAPASAVIVLPTTVYGGNTALLGEPSDWFEVIVNGVSRVVPVY